jgi:hypothetical protein
LSRRLKLFDALVSDVGHDLYVQLAIDVSSAYRTDAAKQKTLLGSYESRLAEYRSNQAKARKRGEKDPGRGQGGGKGEEGRRVTR